MQALAAEWPVWVARHNAAIRARLDQGDSDSLVNFWFYGTTFTSLPRATHRDLMRIGGPGKASDLLGERLDALLDGIAQPGTNERLQFAGQVLARHGIDVTSEAGRDRAWQFLDEARTRMMAENDQFRREAMSASRVPGDPALTTFATLFRNRGLSSDSSIPVDFALDRALTAFTGAAAGSGTRMTRVAIVGPGLDFTDKAEGYDFYPPQTIQPFALVDSLLRLGLAAPDDLRIATFDLSPRVNAHLDSARLRASAGQAYLLHAPLSKDDAAHQWQAGLVAYWQRMGERVGTPTAPLAPPSGAGDVRVRALLVRPAVVLAIEPHDLNVVLERLELPADRGFDLIVATNVLLYYDRFEQSLALTNIARMLRPGGYLLTNYKMSAPAPLEAVSALTTTVPWDHQGNQDTMFWYRK
jgi:SAM-dependent methyltransferase